MSIITICEQELMLLPEKAIFWTRTNTLLVADLHLGKSGHFRKAGIPVSSKVHDDDLRRLSKIIGEFPIKKIYLLGDLFHSSHNREWEQFVNWRDQFPGIEFHLVKGNHDILDEKLISDGRIEFHREQLTDGPFIFSHQPLPLTPRDLYLFTGHIHPGVRLEGKGLQSISLPCFWFGKNTCVLPAFGNFTGHSNIVPLEHDIVFMIYNNSVEQLARAVHAHRK